MKIEKIRNKDGITLIALIITIIVMLILAGIVLGLTISENGIMKKAEGAGLAYSEQEAREKLELVLLDMQADKVVNSEYDQYGYLTSKIQEKGMVVNGDLVFVDGWRFTIDRNVPKISGSIGKGQPNEEIKLTLSQEVSSDYVKSTIKVEIEYAGIISFIQIAGEEIQVPEKQDGKYIVTKEVTQNGTYSVLVKDEENKYQMKSIEVTEITEDMDIKNKEELEAFRDRVNSGRTYEGRTVRVVADIDLQGTEGNQWTPIGTENVSFKGTFDGNYHTISNVYIDSQDTGVGLFKTLDGATVQKLILSDAYIHTSATGAGNLAWQAKNSAYIYQVWIKSGDIYATAGAGGIFCGLFNNSKIEECINNGTVKIRTSLDTDYVLGGLVGGIESSGTIINSYNTGSITGKNLVGGITGYTRTGGRVDHCYNIGNIFSSMNVGGIVGELGGSIVSSYVGDFITITGSSNRGYIYGWYRNGTATSSSTLTSEQLKGYATNLGDVWQRDTSNINNGYPILKWQVGR